MKLTVSSAVCEYIEVYALVLIFFFFLVCVCSLYKCSKLKEVRLNHSVY